MKIQTITFLLLTSFSLQVSAAGQCREAADPLTKILKDSHLEAKDMFAEELELMKAAKVLTQKDIDQGKFTVCRERNSREMFFIFEGSRKNRVFVFSSEIGRFNKPWDWRTGRFAHINELPRPKDVHEMNFDLADRRTLLAYEFDMGITAARPEFLFMDSTRHGFEALASLFKSEDPFRREFFMKNAREVLGMLNHFMQVYERSGFESARILKVKSVKSGDELYLLTYVGFLGPSDHFFADDLAKVSLEVQRYGQVTWDHSLSNLNLKLLGTEFNVVGGGTGTVILTRREDPSDHFNPVSVRMELK